MIASDIMSSPVYVVGSDETVAHARNLLLKYRISRLPVMDEKFLAGILTKKDIGYRMRKAEPVWRRRPIDRIPVHYLMTPKPLTVTPTMPVNEIAQVMLRESISGLPVIDKREIAGIVTKSDILRSTMATHLKGRAGDIMEDVVTVSRYHSLDHVIDLISERDDKIVVVNNDGTLAGVITETNLAFYEYPDTDTGVPERDVTRLRRENPAGKKSYRHVVNLSAIAEDVMSRPVVTIRPDVPVCDLITAMRHHEINSLVVAEGDLVRGIVKRDDILKEVAK